MVDKNIIEDVKKHVIKYYTVNKKIPSLNNISRHFKISRISASVIYRNLTALGFFRRKHNTYKMENSDIKLPKKENIIEKYKNDYVLLIIKTIMAVIGAGAVCLSVYYTGIWLSEFLPFFLAYLLSAIMVAFSVIAFEVIIILFQNKQYSIIILFTILWAVVLIFSMVSTVAGQYNQRMVKEITEVKQDTETAHKRMSYNIYEEEEKEILKNIERKEKELIPFQNIMSDFETIEDREKNKWLYWNTHEKIKSINEDIKKYGVELKKVREKKKDFLKNELTAGAVEDTYIKKDSFYIWLSEIFNWDSKHIEFWLSVFPAVFIDLIAPLAIAISMFLRRKEKKE